MENTYDDEKHLKLNVIEEQLKVTKELVETDVVRITKKVHEVKETVNTSLKHEEVRVEKVPINQIVKNHPPVRYEGDTMIVPVVKEVLVVEKKLLLIEEVRITKYTTEIQEENTFPLRQEEIVVERSNNTKA